MDATRTCDQCGKPLPPEGRFCAHCGSFSGASGTASSPGEAPRRGPWERILERLKLVTASRYDVQRLLGWGGMAGVYLAEELRLKRRVAIKVISPGLLMDPSQIERFEQEARTTAQLNHPNIVTIYEVDEREDLHYFTMTYVPGRSLSQVMAEAAEPLSLEVVQAWVRQVAGALSYAHQRGVVHRDIKPGNILLDEQGNALVGDFGIAKVAEEPGLTRTGMLVGTPAYMSPEQCTTGKVTGASDQYSLGAVAYQLIAGDPPFSGSTIHVIQAHVSETPRDVRELRPECPDDLADVVMRMLAKAPEDRWPSLYDAVDAIGGRALRHDDPLRAVMARLSAWTHGVELLPPEGLAGDQGRSTLAPGDVHRFRARAVDYRGEPFPDRAVEWSVSPEGVVTVDDDGRVEAVAPGRATVIATSGRVRAEWAFKVGSSVTTGPITPAAGTPAFTAPVAGDPAPTPGPPPPPSSAPPTPAPAVPAAPTPVSASPDGVAAAGPDPADGSAVPLDPETPEPPPDRPEPAFEPEVGDEPADEPADGTLVMNLDGADDDPITRVVAADAWMTGGAEPDPGPVPVPDPVPEAGGSTTAAPPPEAEAAPVFTRSRRRPEKKEGPGRMPVAIGVGVVAVAAVGLVFAFGGGDDATSEGGGGDDPTGGVAVDGAAEGAAPGDRAASSAGVDSTRVVAVDADSTATPDDASSADRAGATGDPTPPVERPASTPTTSDAPPREATPAAPAPGAVRILGDLPAGATVRVRGAGVDRVSADRTLRLAPGTYTLEIRAEGYRPATADVTVREGATQDWRPVLTAVPAPADDPAPPPDPPADDPDPEPSPADDAGAREARIVGAVQAFGSALQSREPARLRAAWPSISDAAARPWEQFMASRDVRNLQVDITIPSVPGGDGDRIEVPFLLRLRYENPGAPPPADPIPYRAVVQRQGDAWVLTDVRAGG